MDVEARRGELIHNNFHRVSNGSDDLWREAASRNFNISSLQPVASQSRVDIDLYGVSSAVIGVIPTAIVGNRSSNCAVVLCNVMFIWLLVPTRRIGENTVSSFRKVCGSQQELKDRRIDQLWQHRCVEKSLTPHLIASVFNILTDVMCEYS